VKIILIGIGALAVGGLFVTAYVATVKPNPVGDPLFPFYTSGHVFYALALEALLLFAFLFGMIGAMWAAGLSLAIVGGTFTDLWIHQYSH
jgi:hypothetical protein